MRSASDRPAAISGVDGNHLDRRPPDLGLQGIGRSLRDDVAVIDDPDSVGEDICLGHGKVRGSHRVIRITARPLSPGQRAERANPVIEAIAYEVRNRGGDRSPHSAATVHDRCSLISPHVL